MSWGGRGRDDEARERMIDAARRSGMSVSELVQALAEGSPGMEGREKEARRRRLETPEERHDRWDRADRADRPNRPERLRASAERDDPADIDRQLDMLADRLRNLSSEPAPRVRSRERTSDTTLDEIAAKVDRLSRRISEPPAARPATARSKPQTDVTAVLSALDGLDRRVKAMSDERAAPRARRERTAFGDIDRAIAEIAQHQSTLERKRPAPMTRRSSVDTDIERHFRELSEKIETLRGRDEQNSPEVLVGEIRSLRQFIEQHSSGSVDIGAEIRKLADRIDAMASQKPERAALEPLMTEMGRLRDVVLQSDIEGSLKSLEAGYGHIVDRLDDLKRGLSNPRVGAKVDAEISEIHNLLRAVPQVSQFSSIEQSVRDLADKVGRITRDEEDPVQSRIERRIADLEEQIGRIDTNKVVKALDQRLKTVTDKLDVIESATRGPVTAERIVDLLDELRATAAGSRTGEELRALESRLAELAERIADLDSRRPSFDDTDRLHDRIAEISGKLDRMTVPVTDRRTVDALETVISRLDEMMTRQRDIEPVGPIADRLSEIVERLHHNEITPQSRDIDALGSQIAEMRRELAQTRGGADLEAEMRKLAERLERSIGSHEPDDEVLNQIEEQLAHISRRLDTNETRFNGLTGIETTIRRIGDRLDAHQSETLAAAREAAREMVREIGDRGGDDGVSETVLRALQDDLRSLRSAARDTENRTADTLISLHDALSGIVGRLTAIEKIAQGSARNAAARPAAAMEPPAARPAAQPAPTVAAVERPQPPIAAQPAPGGGIASAVNRAREALVAASPEDTRPLEPGSGKPVPRATPQAAAAAGPDRAEATSPAGAGSIAAAARKADFIAAARRAAQAAAATVAPGEAPLTANAEDRASAQAATGTDGPDSSSPLSRIGQVLKNRRRPLLLATGALVLAVMTLRLIPGGGDERLPESAAAPRNDVQNPTETASRAATPAAGEKAASGDALATTAPAPQPAAAPAPTVIAPPAEKPQAAVPAAVQPGALPEQPSSQRTSLLTNPTPDRSLFDAPTTTGSIPMQETTRASAPTSALALPAKIGSDRLRSAALAGDPRAAFEVGMRYAEGRGIAADAKAAVDWYTRAAEAGLVPAQYRLAVALEKGIGVARDSEQAKRWYQSAAEAGNVRAMHNLGVLHANARDIASAMKWFQKAADLGLKDSQFNLGIVYALGSGVKQDLAVSYKWFALAGRQGDKEAEKKQNDVSAHLDKVNLAAARMAVQTWVQKPLDRDANEEAQVWTEPPEAPKTAAVSERDTVLKVQSLLQSRGVYSGPLDGQMGKGTRTAIRTFQKKVGQPQTGELDGQLLQALGAAAI